MTREVYRRDLQQTLLDIEDWAAEMRELLEWIPEDARIATVVGGEDVVARIPDVDDMPVPEDAPGIVAPPLLRDNVLSVIEYTPPIVLPCQIPAKGSCKHHPVQACGEVRARHLYRAMRSMEILCAVCRYSLGRMDPDQVIRPRLSDE